jgi:hypothetical protein
MRMTRSGQNVSAAEPAEQRRQEAYLLVAGGNYPHRRWSAQKTLCYLGELNGSAQARWLKTVEVFNEQGEREQLKLFPAQVEPPAGDPQREKTILLMESNV